MSPEVANLIQVIALDAIKILGPAVIAAYATYRATTVQWEVKLKELDRTNEFLARERVFAHLKERLAHIDEETEKLHGAVGEILGRASGAIGEAPTPQDLVFMQIMGEFIITAGKTAPLEVRGLLQDMQVADLGSTAEYKALSAYQDIRPPSEPLVTYDELKAALFQLLDLNNHLGLCIRLLIQKRMECVFAHYIAESRAK